ncbi:MAG: hypothetical protein LBS69_06955 [Prevotellaceae bacterium]|nr:hypothetical protein [Prevotellaceae bacterium]
MIMSLGMMGGINGNSQDSSLQQVSIGCAWIAGETEVGPDATSAWSRASDITGGICVGMAVNGAYHAYATSTNPVGWGYWAVTGLFGL